MATSVLGKRTRSNTEAASKAQPQRAKRQHQSGTYNDENESPFITRRNSERHGALSLADDLMELDELSADTPTASPAKHKRAFQIPTPHTPRHRDALSKKVQITPRHRVSVSGKPLTPRTPTTPGGSIPTVYGQARLLFTRSGESDKLIGRESEKAELGAFIRAAIESSSGGCTYVSGPPGTGKSAMVNEVISEIETSSTLETVYVNCMSMKTSKDLYGTLLGSFCATLNVLEGEEEKVLQSMFVPKKGAKSIYLITLDEIDHILTLDLEILYKLFEWSLQKRSHLILIGIANALDLTDRFLPRLKARNLRPELLPFLPYTATQIKTVITTRLKSLMPADSTMTTHVPFVHPVAIDLCARKVASQTGDLRKAFDICRRAIDLIESETKLKHEQALNEQVLQMSPSKRPLEENINLSSPFHDPVKSLRTKTLAQSLATLTAETAPRASIGHVNKITSSTFGNGTNQRLKTLNLQQKAALCALVALEKRKRAQSANVMATPSKSSNAAPTIKALYNNYCVSCTRDAILHPLTSTEFRDVVGSLETLSLISAVDGRNGSFIGLNTPSKRGRKSFGSGVGSGDEKRVGSCVSEKEVAQALEGPGAEILKSILNGEGLE